MDKKAEYEGVIRMSHTILNVAILTDGSTVIRQHKSLERFNPKTMEYIDINGNKAEGYDPLSIDMLGVDLEKMIHKEVQTELSTLNRALQVALNCDLKDKSK